MGVLKIKDDKGNFIDVPAIVGPQGPQGLAGPAGESGVYVGDNEPVNPDVRVWIDTSSEPTSGGNSSQSGGIKYFYVLSSEWSDVREYQFEEGMTWQEWIDSEYNIDDWEIGVKQSGDNTYVRRTYVSGSSRYVYVIKGTRAYEEDVVKSFKVLSCVYETEEITLPVGGY